MKRIIGLLFIAVGMCGAFGTIAVTWDSYIKKRPPISMPAAYLVATESLGVATNDFFCVAARLSTNGGRPKQIGYGEWSFIFCNTNGNRKEIYVFMGENKTAQATEVGNFKQ